jgi:hypothetical protein
MFISYNYKEYSGYKDGKHTWGYEITDSEFGIASGVVSVEKETVHIIEPTTAVIQEYSKRNLNVAKNLALALIWEYKQYPFRRSIQQIIDRNKKHIPPFQQYEDDLNKYLVLL